MREIKKRKRGRPKKKRIFEQQPSLFEMVEKKKAVRDELKAILKIEREAKQAWRGVIATPPGSLLEAVCTAFYEYTDIPLEIPFFVTISLISSLLLRDDVIIDFQGATVRPDLWTVILATSGAGKTLTEKTVRRSGEKGGLELRLMPDCASAAAFVQQLKEKNKGIWIRDEFSQFLKAIETQSYLQELKDYLLRLYDGERIERKTKKECIVIEDPALTILGLCPTEHFIETIPVESLVDGFAQRFNYIIAEPDPDRDPRKNPEQYAWYPIGAIENRIKDKWSTVLDTKRHKVYHVDEGGFEAYKTSFALLVQEFNKLDMSFHRRIMYRAVKYAAIYHVLLGKKSNKIDAADIGWGTRVCVLHIKDVGKILTQHSMSDLQLLLLKVENLKERIQKEEGRGITPKDVVRHINQVRYVHEAKALLSLI